MQTFGEIVANKRKEMKISQRELAKNILKEDGNAISPQYLNDLERDRRNPPSDHLINEFSRELDLEFDYLIFYAGRFPNNLPKRDYSSDEIVSLMQAFRRPKEE